MSTTRKRTRGEQGLAIVMTALCLIPLMIFAAFGVDLASWYSRISYLQKAADAASLAGTVWMPDIGEATDVACDSLEKNGIVGNASSPNCGTTGAFLVTVERGSTATSLRVIVEDPDAVRYFSQVFRGTQSLARSAEAEYNLPIPLGSPLNYFGGDRTRTVPPTPPTTYSVSWPTNFASWSPAEMPSDTDCNVASADNQPDGRWNAQGNSAPQWQPTNFSGSNGRCTWTARPSSTGAASATVPPDWETRAPTNAPCNVFQSTAGANGHWPNVNRYQPGQRNGSTQCQWLAVSAVDPASLPPAASGGAPAPTNRPCRVSHSALDGWWGPNSSSGYSASGAPTSVTSATINNGYRLCRWNANITSTTPPTPPNPIDVNRSPGFWAMIEGPDAVSTNGDAFMPRCYINNNCGSVQNAQHEPDTDVDRGYWYVVKMPNTNLASVDINVFDASYDEAGSITTNAGDRSLSGSEIITTEFRVYQQNNLLDFTDHAPVTLGAANQTEGSCNWSLGDQTAFKGVWSRLCTITAPAPNSIYLINVRTVGDVGNGINGYALEAESNNHVGTQPALYAYENMGMQNNNRCTPAGSCTPPPATFYLAEVGQQYAGKTLVLDLWDPGDVSSGNAAMFPQRPSTDPGTPGAVVDVPADECEYASTPSPNLPQTTSDGGATGAVVPQWHASDFGARCGVTTATGGARRLNGVWLTIRIAIPADYTCTAGINPVTTGGSCWWGIEYIFSEASQDVTTWQARIEGNPVHLTT